MSKRFGQEKIYVCISSPEEFMDHKELIEDYAGGILALDYVQDTIGKVSHMQLILHTEKTQEENLFRLLNKKRNRRTYRSFCQQPGKKSSYI